MDVQMRLWTDDCDHSYVISHGTECVCMHCGLASEQGDSQAAYAHILAYESKRGEIRTMYGLGDEQVVIEGRCPLCGFSIDSDEHRLGCELGDLG